VLLHAGTAQRCCNQLSTEGIIKDELVLARRGRRDDAPRHSAAAGFAIMPCSAAVHWGES